MIKSTKSWLKIALFIVFFVLIDQITKYLATVYLKGKNEFVVIPNILSFNYLNGGNAGAAWGMFAGKTALFIVFTIIAIILIVKFIYNLLELLSNYSLNNITGRILIYAMSLLIAGALGNMIDRILYGCVTDFISFQFIEFPIFNVADCYVTCSCLIIAIICFFKLDEKQFDKIFSIKNKNK